jgi:hypothetical protein
MLPAPHVETPPVPALGARPAAVAANDPLYANASRAWQLQFELAWSYPRFCYAVWSQLLTLDR